MMHGEILLRVLGEARLGLRQHAAWNGGDRDRIALKVESARDGVQADIAGDIAARADVDVDRVARVRIRSAAVGRLAK